MPNSSRLSHPVWCQSDTRGQKEQTPAGVKKRRGAELTSLSLCEWAPNTVWLSPLEVLKDLRIPRAIYSAREEGEEGK